MKRNRWMWWCGRGLVLATVLLFGSRSPATTEPTPTQSAGTNAVSLTDEQLGDLLQATILLARMGLYDEAEARCIQILEQRPNEPTVKQLLGEIQDRRRQQNPSADLKHKLEDIIIPEVIVRDAAAADVIDLLQAETQKRSVDKTAINFVWQAPEEAKTAKVTLNLRNVPLADALKYVTDGVGLRYRVDAHAVVIFKPLPAASKESGPANVKSQ